MIDPHRHRQIGSLLFEGLDQIDLTEPFEVLSRIPNATYRLYGKSAEPVCDLKGFACDRGHFCCLRRCETAARRRALSFFGAGVWRRFRNL